MPYQKRKIVNMLEVAEIARFPGTKLRAVHFALDGAGAVPYNRDVAHEWAREIVGMDWKITVERAPYFVNGTRVGDLKKALDRVATTEGYVRFADSRGTVWFDDDLTDPESDFSGLDELDSRVRERAADVAAFEAMAEMAEEHYEAAFGSDWKGRLVG